ncbi:hypothetical protein V8D89_009573 [Ganoderma adspersum]
MSAHVTRKRVRATEEDEALPPPKRELDPDGSVDPSNIQPDANSEGQVREDQVFKQDEEFWFEDGTVILVACDTTEFRVYEGLLARLSPVFWDLFAEGHELRIVRMRGGQTFSCPVVDVSDTPEDLRHLLRACFSRRLGSYIPPGWSDLEAIGVVNLARLTGELSVLPSAFVVCICASSQGAKNGSGIGYGIVREDGSREFLSPHDLSLCFEGKTYLRTATVAAVFRTFDLTVSRGCKTPPDCKRTLRTVLLGLERSLNVLLDGNPFATYEEFVLGHVHLGVCPTCTGMVENQSLKERKRVWNRLPELLGIDVPGWGEQAPQEDAN